MTQDSSSSSGSSYDVVVIGGGAAGLSAAVVLGRARRAVVVVDAGSPRNAPAAGVHGFLSRDGISPGELLTVGRREVEHYGGTVVAGEAHAVHRTDRGFEVVLADGSRLSARRLLVTTGLVDRLPAVEGVKERWGRDVLHCPYCHGWEVRDQSIGILGTSSRSVHQALLFRQWSPDVVLFQHTAFELTAAEEEQLAARGIRVVPGEVAAVVVEDDRLTGLRLRDATLVAREAVVVGPEFVARSALLESLGLAASDHPMGVGQFVAADVTGRTNVPGVWVAGNVTDLMAQVVAAAAGGVMAAAAINADLVLEDTDRAVAAYRERAVAGAA